MRRKETIGVVGLGVVGETLCAQCKHHKHNVHVYDVCASMRNQMHIKYKVQPHTTVNSLVRLSSVLLVALPTENPIQDAHDTCEPHASAYDLKSFHALLQTVFICTTETSNQPLVFIYSTLTPHTIDAFKQRWPTLHLFHVPEFLSSATAMLDTFHPTRRTVLLGIPDNTPASVTDRARVVLGSLVHESQEVTVVRSAETEATKLFCNAFYATKVQLCNEFYTLCQKHHIAYDTVRHLMLQQGWIHPMHTQVPGPNGERGFGGKCLPKDLEALCRWSEQTSVSEGETDTTDACAPCEVLHAVRSEHRRQQQTTQNESNENASAPTDE